MPHTCRLEMWGILGRSGRIWGLIGYDAGVEAGYDPRWMDARVYCGRSGVTGRSETSQRPPVWGCAASEAVTGRHGSHRERFRRTVTGARRACEPLPVIDGGGDRCLALPDQQWWVR